MSKLTRSFLLLSAVLFAATPLQAQRKPITAEEITRSAAHLNTAYDVVNALRPRWLQVSHEVVSMQYGQDPRVAETHVYVGGADKGGVDYLKSIPAEHVSTIRWLSTNEAGSEFGPNRGPAIVLELRP